MEINKKILLIDDQEEILNSLKKLLAGEDNLSNINNKMKDLVNDFFKEESKEKETYDVHTALDGETGYKLVKKALEEGEPYSVVTVDMRMPGWDGLKTAQEIRKIDSNIEIIIITAYTDIKREELVNKIGKPEKLLYLKKPFEKEEILQVILSLTTKWSLEQKVKNQLQLIKYSKQNLEEVMCGISEIEKSIVFSLKVVYKTIAEEFMKIIKCEKAYLVMENEVFRWGELGEDCLAFEELKDRVVENKSYVIDSTKIYVNFFCDKNYCDINGAIGVFKYNRDLLVNEKIIDIFISHSNNLLKSANLYMQLQQKNNELLISNKKLMEANALNKKFLVISSHELRTPGTIIGAYADLLASGKAKEPEKIAQGLQNAAGRLNILIEQMLEVFATSEIKDSLVVKRNYYTVDEIFKEIFQKIEIFLLKRNQSLIIINHENIEYLYIDKNKVIEFILFNLLMNAIKFSKDGAEIKMTISKKNGKALVSIIDEGVGMNEYEKNNMYKALFVGGEENHHHSGLYEYKAKGLGLGLTIVKNIIDMIGEEISCESILDKGTKIEFTLPLSE
ncbi:MAG: hybrid sensor histidine kinase/response regulator [Fusobacteriaceae bacterium]|nr:hybrid sensor histidine kinase/response regulator [Fusobacteriaceae bacterium]MBP6467148.1 hybrid sensor histidine kinase/response regulator [Fusobacteriaceae bacterium]MBP9596191.1 hybrid sensor histidine kinase/response regulator [Fusobacteriaceae bacterium]MBU9917591.1 hybrid sensor histidine kinase/response regulator [Fusobacteriaceae bacterium]